MESLLQRHPNELILLVRERYFANRVLASQAAGENQRLMALTKREHDPQRVASLGLEQ